MSQYVSTLAEDINFFVFLVDERETRRQNGKQAKDISTRQGTIAVGYGALPYWLPASLEVVTSYCGRKSFRVTRSK